MAVPPVVRSRRRFMPSDDIIILQEVLKHNPFDDPTMWVKISEKLSELTQVVRNLRSVRERLDLLLAQFLRDDIKNRKKSGTEEVYEVVHRLLQQVADLAREYSYRPPRSAVQSHRGTNKGRPVCAAASAAGAKQRQPSTRKTAAMECFAASSTDCGENSDVHVFVPEPEEEPDDPGRWASSGWPASPEPCCLPLPLSTIPNHVGDGVRCLVEGDEVVAAGHIIECSAVASTCCSDGPVHVIAFVLQSAMHSKDPHRVDLKLTDETKIELNCTCPAGTSHKCKHCIAVLLHINKVRQLILLSTTDLPQSWGQNAKYTVKQKYRPTPINELPCCPKFQEPAVS
ncbi:uncharacterized protein LOC142592574 isoform X2 [Dermacentor variabilis]|uniref:uncharacterized protein LOC142592574 isoform X2 n=1 Tax=Dermacentor variabilis TaxID=34621 RepID=UPI003F5B2A50